MNHEEWKEWVQNLLDGPRLVIKAEPTFNKAMGALAARTGRARPSEFPTEADLPEPKPQKKPGLVLRVKTKLGMKPPGGGWQVIPGGKKQGFRKQEGGKWVYWYPGMKEGGSQEEAERHVATQQVAHHEKQEAKWRERAAKRHGQDQPPHVVEAARTRAREHQTHATKLREKHGLKKAEEGSRLILKAAMPVGTVSQWASGPRKKVAPGKWVPVQEQLGEREHGVRLPFEHLPPPKVGKKISELAVKEAAGKVYYQGVKDFDAIWKGAVGANDKLIDSTYALSKATGGVPAWPPSVLADFPSDKALEDAKAMALKLKERGVFTMVPVDEDTGKELPEVWVFEPQASQALADHIARKHGKGKPPPPENSKGLKGKARTKEKLEGKLGGKAEKLNDLARASIKYDSIKGVYSGLQAILDHPEIEVVKFVDRFRDPVVGGYRDIMLKVKINDHVAELQLHVGEILDIKMGEGHKLYEEVREIFDKVAREKRKYTRKEVNFILKNMKKQHVLYDGAYKRALAKGA